MKAGEFYTEYKIQTFLDSFNSDQTKRAYKTDIKSFFNFLKEVGTEVQSPSDMKLEHFINYKNYLRASFTDNTVNRRLASLKSLMKWFHLQGLIETNYMESLKIPKASPKKPTEAFTDGEVNRLLEVSLNNLTHNLVFTVLFNLGLRSGELVKISKKDLYELNGHKILRVKGKGNKLREIPLKEELYDRLRSTSSDRVFKYTEDGVYKLLKRYCKRLNIKNKSPHSCRATIVSHLLDNNVAIHDVADYVGHESITTTAIYDKKRKGFNNSPAYKVKY